MSGKSDGVEETSSKLVTEMVEPEGMAHLKLLCDKYTGLLKKSNMGVVEIVTYKRAIALGSMVSHPSINAVKGALKLHIDQMIVALIDCCIRLIEELGLQCVPHQEPQANFQAFLYLIVIKQIIIGQVQSQKSALHAFDSIKDGRYIDLNSDFPLTAIAAPVIPSALKGEQVLRQMYVALSRHLYIPGTSCECNTTADQLKKVAEAMGYSLIRTNAWQAPISKMEALFQVAYADRWKLKKRSSVVTATPVADYWKATSRMVNCRGVLVEATSAELKPIAEDARFLQA